MMVSREEMIDNQLIRKGISDRGVLKAMRLIDRALFIPKEMREFAYEDRPLSIGKGQTISQPFIVAYMAQELKLKSHEVILEIGTGCGYNSAIMATMVKAVYTIEAIQWLEELACDNLKKSGIKNVTTRVGDGFYGWPEKAPFNAISITAAPPSIPEPLKKQLTIGGRLLAPVGRQRQQLKLLQKTGDNSFIENRLLMVSFVPMTGKAQGT